ncbi:hypothetical protein S14_48 [Shewanella sp. phage 1/4]|uniref:hypothetical protein n=1 Tax=Shewanella phage 1/4 TaxID=1458859 RepID=UPI0004F600E3|nr:hypothetical protein S14_48 [Shewanella sp. phage 1/4]AHK11160.1 hypothetical protein S14_48 [Shewanella sp. phage 1/4]
MKMSDVKLKTLDILCGELCEAMLDDEHGDGVDIAGGMYGEETTIWIKSVASKMDKLTEQNKMLLLDVATLKKAIGSAVVAIENESDMDKASSLLTRALANTEDFK